MTSQYLNTQVCSKWLVMLSNDSLHYFRTAAAFRCNLTIVFIWGWLHDRVSLCWWWTLVNANIKAATQCSSRVLILVSMLLNFIDQRTRTNVMWPSPKYMVKTSASESISALYLHTRSCKPNPNLVGSVTLSYIMSKQNFLPERYLVTSDVLWLW